MEMGWLVKSAVPWAGADFSSDLQTSDRARPWPPSLVLVEESAACLRLPHTELPPGCYAG